MRERLLFAYAQIATHDVVMVGWSRKICIVHGETARRVARGSFTPKCIVRRFWKVLQPPPNAMWHCPRAG